MSARSHSDGWALTVRLIELAPDRRVETRALNAFVFEADKLIAAGKVRVDRTTVDLMRAEVVNPAWTPRDVLRRLDPGRAS